MTENDEEKKTTLIETMKKYGLSLALLLYMVFIMVEPQLGENRTLALLPIDIVFLIKTYRRLKKLYVLLKIRTPAHLRN